MIDYSQYFFYGFFTVALLEMAFSYFLNPWYFLTGITIYRKNYILHQRMQFNAQSIKNKWVSDEFAAKLIFKDTGENEVALRESMKREFAFGFYYAPIMRGLIRRNSLNNGVEIVGFLNWSVIAMAINVALILIISSLVGVIFNIFFIVICYICYRIQSQRFEMVGLIFDEVK